MSEFHKELQEKLDAILREVEARKEEYIKAWFAQHGAMPGDVHLVHREMTGGEWIRVEMRTDTDPVLELVRASRALAVLLQKLWITKPEDFYYLGGNNQDDVMDEVYRLARALEHFKRIP